MVSSALDVSSDGFNDYEKNLVEMVRKYGWYRTTVLPEEGYLGFSYTLGFWLTAGTPEIITFSLPSDAAHGIFQDLFDMAKAGERFPIGQPIPGVVRGFEIVLLPVAPSLYPDYLVSTRWFYGGEDWPCLQLIWPDPIGRFPWQSGFDPAFAGSQPNLSGAPWPAI